MVDSAQTNAQLYSRDHGEHISGPTARIDCLDHVAELGQFLWKYNAKTLEPGIA